MAHRLTLPALLLTSITSPLFALAQQPAGGSMKTLQAVRTDVPITIDGRLDEAAWAGAAVAEARCRKIHKLAKELKPKAVKSSGPIQQVAVASAVTRMTAPSAMLTASARATIAARNAVLPTSSRDWSLLLLLRPTSATGPIRASRLRRSTSVTAR